MTPAAGGLPAAEHRHLIENALAIYCRAIDDQDAPAAGQLLTNARLHFKDQAILTCRDDIVALYAAAFHDSAPTHLLISNLLVRAEGQDTAYRATYQRWSLGCSAPVCEAIGEYRGLFTAASDRLVWTEHRILQS